MLPISLPPSFSLSLSVSLSLCVSLSLSLSIYTYNTHSHCSFSYTRNERQKYYHHREKSRQNPEKFITVIVDGMDQSKTNVPNLSRRTKSTQNLWHLPTHVTGVLVHTRSTKGKKAFAFCDLYQYQHDSNLSINVLIMALLQSIPKLPPVLYLQFDNCYRENKNRFILAFCAFLVHQSIFRKVHGHGY